MTVANGVSNADINEIAPQVTKNLAQEDFLRLMVAQIQNHDPIQSPFKGEFLSQFAQFGAKDGISHVHDSMQQMTNSLQSNQALQASALVGRKVMISSDSLKLEKEGNVKIAIDMPSGASNLNASIYGESGQLMKTIVLGQQKPGFFQFAWDGTGQDGVRLEEGKYKVAVHDTYVGQEVVVFETLVFANVDSVSLGQSSERLRLNVSGAGLILLEQVKYIIV
ncbi:flagellar hook assembly protein FlgD [Legionella sp.]|uniref:flagellar hook assembly protein FlgD n=1 Tax=Legionella sp. TaxID=459 RepID=UPI003CAE5318